MNDDDVNVNEVILNEMVKAHQIGDYPAFQYWLHKMVQWNKLIEINEGVIDNE